MTSSPEYSNFIEKIIQEDLYDGKNDGKVHLRFPPEPSGHLHIGHTKAICLNFDLAKKFNGKCNLRFDDTNPCNEEQEYVDAIKRDILWLGYQWNGEPRYASSYFQTLYEWAIHLIQKGLAYVDQQDAESVRTNRGTLTSPGIDSPYRNRSVEENSTLFEKMRTGAFKEGEAVLRAKIDMAHPNMNMRDPILYRISFQEHHQTKKDWCIYPSYDFAHGQEDAIEGITHSLCTLEFEDNRPLYEWFLDHLPVPCRPRQYEFSALNITYIITSKRKLKRIVEQKLVDGWDDPRLPTLSGLRRRGVPAASIHAFCKAAGVSRSEGLTDIAMFESFIREYLNKHARRIMVVTDPIKVLITNLPEDHHEQIHAPYHTQDDSMGGRNVHFTKELYIERSDFTEEKPNKKWKRLFLNGEVRLRHGYIIRCDKVIYEEDGTTVQTLLCHYDPNTLGKDPVDRKVKGVIHWVDAASSLDATLRLYDRLFTDPTPDGHKDKDYLDFINPNSLTLQTNAKVESSFSKKEDNGYYQFERIGYFCLDSTYTDAQNKLIFNQTISLRDSWK